MTVGFAVVQLVPRVERGAKYLDQSEGREIHIIDQYYYTDSFLAPAHQGRI